MAASQEGGDSVALPPGWEDYSDEDKAQLLEVLHQLEYKRGLRHRPWRATARNKQLPPDDQGHRLPWTHPDSGESYRCEDPRCLAGEVDNNWSTWLFMAGRGTGKTFLGANWLMEQALAQDGTYWAICGPTYGDVRSILIEGKTGILKQALPGDIPKDGYNRNNQEIRLRNGSTIIGCSAEKTDSPRGHNFSGAWLDELCQFEKPEFFHEGLMPALREGDAKLLITTTPRRTRLLRELLKNAENPEYHIHVTRGATRENPYYSKRRLAELEMKYKGTHLYKQELLGELIEDLQGSLFNLDMINAARIRREEVPESLAQVVVAIDPAMGSGSRSDESGIIVAAEDGEGHAYLLADRSCKGSPDKVMRTAVAAFHEFGADTIVCEANQGGDYLDAALKAVDPSLSIRKVHAMRGKFIRAEPIAILMEQQRIHHVGSGADFQELEDQLLSITKDSDRNALHDDRADAWVWAFSELKGITQGSYMTAYGLIQCKECGKTLKKYMGTCPGCGAFNEPPETVSPRDAAPRDSWADTYARRCDQCGELYPKDRPRCPRCFADPAEFLKNIEAYNGMFTGRGVRTRGLAGVWRKGGYR